MDIFQEQIESVRRRETSALRKLTINLAVAQDDFEYSLSGNFFYVWSAPANTYVDIKINRNTENAIPYVEQTGARVPFEKLYITTPAGQAGDLILIYGTEFPDLVQVIDNRAEISANIADIVAELQGDLVQESGGIELTVGNAAAVQILAANADRKGCIVQAKSTNLGIVYLYFDNTVATNKWFAELQAGMAFCVDDFRGDIYAIATIAGQLVGYGEW